MSEGNDAWQLTLGKASLPLHELMGIAAFSLLAFYAWFVFGYGYCDPPGVQAGYLTWAVPVAFAFVFVACLVAFARFGFVEWLMHSQLVTLLAGVVCAATALPIASGSTASSMGNLALGALTAVNTLTLFWGVFLCVHTLADDHEPFRCCVQLLLVVLFTFLLCEFAYELEEPWTYAAFCAAPILAAALLLVAAWAWPRRRESGVHSFWIVSFGDARLLGERGRIDVTALVGERFKPARRSLALMLGSVLLACFFIAFVRFAGLQNSSGFESHQVGAAGSAGLIAVVMVVLLCVVLMTGRCRFMHWCYIVGVLGMCFPALVLAFSGFGNIPVVRVLENVSYVLYAASVGYAVLVWLAKLRLHPGSLLPLFGAAGSLGTVAGWLAQFALLQQGEDAWTLALHASVFVVLAYALFGFSVGEYRFFVENDFPAGGEEGPDAAPVLADSGAEDPGWLVESGEPGEATREPDGKEAILAAEVPGAAGPGSKGEVEGIVGGAKEDISRENSGGDQSDISALDGSGAHEEGSSSGAAAQSDELETEPGSDAGHLPPRRGISFREAISLAVEQAGLSRREAEILSMLLKGYSDQRIAEELVLSYHTVRSHVRHIYVKMDVHSREEISDYVNAVQEREGARD